jgi:hypothetical protein
MKRRLRNVIAVGFGLVLTTAPLFAHHLGQTAFDSSKKISLEGRITKVAWQNPHIYYEMDVKDKDGKVVSWELEGGEPNPLHRRGWRKDDLQVGDLLTLRDASTARDGSHRVSGGVFLKNGGIRVFNGNGPHTDELEGVAAPPTDPKVVANARDFSGLWGQGTGSTDISTDLLPGEEISLTPYGAERYKKVDIAKSGVNWCLPYGPTRSIISIAPALFVQSPNALVLLFEPQIDYRVIYLDGRNHPGDVSDYPTWFGDSTAKWDGDTLVVDTVGVDDRTWLDSFGFEHSDKLHLIERIKKTDPNTLTFTTTVEDPVFFTKPFTYSFTKKRSEDPKVVLGNAGPALHFMPIYCEENKDVGHMLPTPGSHRVEPTFPK